MRPTASFPVNLDRVSDLEPDDKPSLASGHYQGSVVYVVHQMDDGETRVQTFVVGPYSIELRAVRS